MQPARGAPAGCCSAVLYATWPPWLKPPTTTAGRRESRHANAGRWVTDSWGLSQCAGLQPNTRRLPSATPACCPLTAAQGDACCHLGVDEGAHVSHRLGHARGIKGLACRGEARQGRGQAACQPDSIGACAPDGAAALPASNAWAGRRTALLCPVLPTAGTQVRRARVCSCQALMPGWRTLHHVLQPPLVQVGDVKPAAASNREEGGMATGPRAASGACCECNDRAADAVVVVLLLHTLAGLQAGRLADRQAGSPRHLHAHVDSDGAGGRRGVDEPNVGL